MKTKDAKSKPKSSLPLAERKSNNTFHSTYAYGIMRRGKVVGGISSPDLLSIEGAKEWVKDVPRNTKIVKIRITHEVVAEVIP